MKKTFTTIVIITLLGAIACNDANNSPSTTPPEDSTKNIKTIPEEDKKELPHPTIEKKYLILEDGLMSIKIGDPVKQHEQILKKAVQENGEGSFPGYDLLDENQEKIGFVFSQNNNGKHNEDDVVNMIEIYSPQYKTAEGIGVNTTFEELKKAYPSSETHGSEIESRTSTTVGNLSFLLDAYHSSYNIDETKIDPTTKITVVNIIQTKGE